MVIVPSLGVVVEIQVRGGICNVLTRLADVKSKEKIRFKLK